MEWFVLIVLILIGFILLLLEFMVFPGVNIVGLIGLICIGVAIYVAYSQLGATAGHITLAGIAVGGFTMTILALRSNTWRRLQLDSEIDSTVEGVDSSSIKEGDLGTTVGRLAPMGKVRVGDQIVEGQSIAGLIDENRDVEVVKVYRNKIIVKLKNE